MAGMFAPAITECNCRQTKDRSTNVIITDNVAPSNPNISNMVRVANTLQRSKGGRPSVISEHEIAFAKLRMNVLGKTYGQYGGSGEPIRNRF